MISFYKHYMSPRSEARAKLSVYLVAQAQSDVSTKQISELIGTLNIGADRAAQAATDLQARLSAAGNREDKEIAGLTDYLLHDLKVAEDKIDAAVEAWARISKTNGATNGTLVNGQETDAKPVPSTTKPVLIDDVGTFKSGLQASVGALPVRDVSEYEELDPKL
jgi:insulysin